MVANENDDKEFESSGWVPVKGNSL